MPAKVVGPKDFKWVRSIYGQGPDAAEKYAHISPGKMNEVIKAFHAAQPTNEVRCATPSRLLTCPRVVWLQQQGVASTKDMTWAVKQRMMLGRQLEDLFAMQLESQGLLLHHWADNPGQEVKRFGVGEGVTRLEGVPDYLLNLDGTPTVSDAKTSRSDSFGYVAINAPEIWGDWGWNKYRVQVNAYFWLAIKNHEWFSENNLPLPKQCHLFSYALDDGVVRREVTWTPTDEDFMEVFSYTKRFNRALAATEPPACTCQESFDNFAVKFCDFAVVPEGQKVGISCCGDDLVEKALAGNGRDT